MPQEKSLRFALIQLLSNTSLGLLLIALVADLIAADARFNDWMAVDGKRTLTDDAMLATIDVYEDARIQCLAGVERFRVSADLSGLEAALRQTLETLQRGCRR
jgi:hypothetical protein